MNCKIFYVFLLSFIALAGSYPANAQSIETVQLMPVCPPKNCASCRTGELAYKLSLDLLEYPRKFEAVIWGQGIENFHKNQSFIIDGTLNGEAFIVESHDDGTDKKKVVVHPQMSPPKSRVSQGQDSYWTISFPSDPDSPMSLIYSINPVIPMLAPVCD